MNRLFRLDNPVWVFISKLYDLVILSILWFLFSLPVITIGPASAALYHSVHTVIVQDSGHTLSTFWRSFRTNLVQGILLTLACLPAAAFVAVSWIFSEALGRENFLGIFYKIVSVAAGFLLCAGMLYLFPLLSRFYMKTKDLLKTAVALAVTRLGFTVLLTALTLVCAGTMLIVPAACFLLPGLMAAAAERLIEPAFQKALDAKRKADESSEAGPAPDGKIES